MGTNTLVYLPGDVRVSDVADVMGILAGLPHKQSRCAEDVEGVKVSTTSSPQMCEITLTGKMFDGSESHRASFHFEVDANSYRKEAGAGQRLLYCGSDDKFWRMVGDGVARFFGGVVDLCDCDDVDSDATYKRPRKRNNPNSDSEWDKFWSEVRAIKPLSMSKRKGYPHAAHRAHE